jgi:RNA-directed DNA polymerase
MEGVMTRPKEQRPAEVLWETTANSAGEALRSRPLRWDWVEPQVWTRRMLQALEQGVKGGRWFSVMDKVWSLRNLRASFAKVKANDGAPGSDRQTIAMFERDLEANLEKLSRELREGCYRPGAVRRVWIDKLGSSEKRPLGIPSVRDRVVQTALRNVIEPIFERDFAEHSYGFRPHRGCKDALRRVEQLLKQGYTWAVDADLKSYFDTIPHVGLMKKVALKISDGDLLALIGMYLKQPVEDGGELWEPGSGSPQGAVISPLLSNIYLNELDQQMVRDKMEMVRYADDLVILCENEPEARRAMEALRVWSEANGLTLHPTKTRIVNERDDAGDGFDFLGYHFERGMRWARVKSVMKLREAIRAKTPRTSGLSLQQIVRNVNRTLRGWFEYFKHSRATTFPAIDSWIRMRLRSILRRRHRLRGRGRGRDHQRWPNDYFARLGYFSLKSAHAAMLRPSRR